MQSPLDSLPITLVGIGLFLAMVTAAEIAGRRRRRGPGGGETSPAAAASVSLLALLISFTFSLTLNRYDSRRDMVVEEAAAITMVWQRGQLQPAPARAAIAAAVNAYIDHRLVYFSEANVDRLRGADGPGRALRQQLWTIAAGLEADGSKPLMARALIDALSRLDDAAARRESIAREHIPITVIDLLMLFACLSAASLGYAGAVHGAVARWANTGFFILVTLAMVLVLDLDRPRTGLVTVSQLPMQELEAILEREPLTLGP